MEMAQSRIVAESRHVYEAIIVGVNQPIATIVTKLWAAPLVGEILGNGGKITEDHAFPNPLAKSELYQLSTPRLVRLPSSRFP
jgi:hypothetical protein